MTVVVDVGCYDHPDHEGALQDSVGRLIDRFHPDELWGFDPHPKMPERASFDRDGTRVTLERQAVWVEPGTVAYDPRPDAPLGAHVGGAGEQVSCVGIGGVVAAAADHGKRVIVKLDCEGAEYPLLRRLVVTGAIRYVDRFLVEWHDLPAREEERYELLSRLPCIVEEWDDRNARHLQAVE